MDAEQVIQQIINSIKWITPEVLRAMWVSNIVGLIMSIGLLVIGFFLYQVWKKDTECESVKSVFAVCGFILLNIIGGVLFFCSVSEIIQLIVAPNACALEHLLSHLGKK